MCVCQRTARWMFGCTQTQMCWKVHCVVCLGIGNIPRCLEPIIIFNLIPTLILSLAHSSPCNSQAYGPCRILAVDCCCENYAKLRFLLFTCQTVRSMQLLAKICTQTGKTSETGKTSPLALPLHKICQSHSRAYVRAHATISASTKTQLRVISDN